MSWLRPGCVRRVRTVSVVAVVAVRRDVPGYGRCDVVARFLCHRRAVTTRLQMPVFAMVLAWSVLTQFALRL